MLLLAFWLLLIAAAFGSVLSVWHLRAGSRSLPSWLLGLLHGLLGAIGFAALLVSLGGPPRGEAMGVAAFGRIAATLLAAALIAGSAVLLARLRYRKVTGLLIGIHATIAIGGIVILAAYVLVG